MNVKKHECSLLTVVSDAGSTPAASTIHNLFTVNKLQDPGKTRVIFVQHFVQ